MTVDLIVTRDGRELRIWSEDGEYMKFEIVDISRGERFLFELSWDTARELCSVLKGIGPL